MRRLRPEFPSLRLPVSGWEYCPILIVRQPGRQRKCWGLSPYREGKWQRDPRSPQHIFICYECPYHGRWYLQMYRLDLRGEQRV